MQTQSSLQFNLSYAVNCL